MFIRSKLYKLYTERTEELFCSLGLIFIGLVSLGYVLWGSAFAETNIQISWFDFPIFIGEILIFVSLICFIGLYLQRGTIFQEVDKWRYSLIGYLLFIFYKTFCGYFLFGPLALRDAALFYYPLFVFFGYSFYRQKFFNTSVNITLFFIIVSLLFYSRFNSYWILTFFILACILIKTYPFRLTKYLLFLLLVCITPYAKFFQTARMMTVSNFLSCIFLCIIIISIMKSSNKVKTICFILGISLLFCLCGKFTNSNALKSILDIRGLKERFNTFDSKVVAKVKQYKQKDLPRTNLFNPDIDYSYQHSNNIMAENTWGVPYKTIGTKKAILIFKFNNTILENTLNDLSNKFFPDRFTPQKQTSGYRDLEGAFNNAIFRIFIWRDMLAELYNKKPIFGFDFGKPFRSISLEILHWGEVEWSRDGWIAAHNSYLNIIYRAGVFGILFIVCIFFVLFIMVKEFILQRSLTGVLLTGIIINWLFAANFLLILELPYNAIPFWTLYGMTCAYYKRLKSLSV